MPTADQLAYTVHEGQGPAALLVHGYLTGGVYWRPNLPALSTVCRPVVVDLWGHDRSPSPTDRDAYEPAGLVAAFERLRTELGEERWYVIGHSLGAALAVQYTLAHPEAVAGLVVTNSNSAFADPDTQAKRAAGARKQADRVEAEGMAAFDGHPLNPSVSKRLPDDVRADLVAAYTRHDPAGLARMLRWTTPNAGAIERLGELRVPTLLTWGVFEKRFRSGAELAMERIEGLRVAELQGGHPVNVQDPDGFDAAVVDFLSDLGAGGR